MLLWCDACPQFRTAAGTTERRRIESPVRLAGNQALSLAVFQQLVGCLIVIDRAQRPARNRYPQVITDNLRDRLNRHLEFLVLPTGLIRPHKQDVAMNFVNSAENCAVGCHDDRAYGDVLDSAGTFCHVPGSLSRLPGVRTGIECHRRDSSDCHGSAGQDPPPWPWEPLPLTILRLALEYIRTISIRGRTAVRACPRRGRSSRTSPSPATSARRPPAGRARVCGCRRRVPGDPSRGSRRR
jgi:hypothetical protein